MVDLRLRDTQTSPAEDIWLFDTTPTFTAPLSIFLHSNSEIEGEGTNDVVLYDSSQWVPVNAPDVELWLRGDMGYETLAPTGNIWRDMSGNGAHAVNTTDLATSSAFGVFGKASTLITAGESLALPTLGTDGGPCTVVVVYRTVYNDVSAQVVAWYGNGKANSVNVGSSYLMRTSWALGATASVSSAMVGHSYGGDNRSHAEIIAWDGTGASTLASTYESRVDGKMREELASSNNANTFTAGIGPFGDEAQVAEVIVYNRRLDGADMASLRAYLDARYVWTPLDLASSAIMWFRGDKGLTPSQWSDSSGNANHATQSNPTYQPTSGTAINGQAAARFSSTQYYDLPASVFCTDGTWSMFSVHKMDAPIVGSFSVLAYWVDQDTNSNAVLMSEGFGYRQTSFCGSYAATTNAVGIDSGNDATARLLGITYSGVDPTDTAKYTSKSNWIGGTVLTDGVFGTVSPYLGGQAATAYGLGGEIAEWILFNGVMSAPDQLSLAEYFEDRYSLISVDATGSGTIAPLVASGSGNASGAPTTGTGSGTLSPLVADGTGAEVFTGTGTGTISSLVAAGSGTETLTGTGSGTLSPLVASGAGEEVLTGTGSGTLQPLVASGSGAEVFTGTGSGTISPLVAASSGTETFTGTGSGTISPLVADGTGIHVQNATGTGSGTISPLVASGVASEIFTGTGSGTLQPLVASGSASEVFTGPGSGTIAPLVASGTGAESMTGTGSGTLQPLVAAGSGTETLTGTGSGTLAPLVASGAAAEVFTGSGSSTLSPLVASGSGSESMTGTGSGVLSPLVADGTGSAASTTSGTGSAALSPLDASGSAVEAMTGTGGGAISPLVASSSGALAFVGAGSAALGPLVAASDGELLISGSGGGVLLPISVDALGGIGVFVIGSGSASLAALIARGWNIPGHRNARAAFSTSRAHAALSTSNAEAAISTSRAKATIT